MAKSVLIVEDDQHIADLLRLYLEKEGYVAAIAPDGGAGVEMFRKLQPELVPFERKQSVKTAKNTPTGKRGILLAEIPEQENKYRKPLPVKHRKKSVRN